MAGATTAERTFAAVAAVETAVPTVCGGDWNHALSGREWAGSIEGRRSVLEAVERLGLQVPTATSPHQIEDLLSIDHIAVPKPWAVSATQRHRAFVGESRISDHDAYVVGVAADHAVAPSSTTPVDSTWSCTNRTPSRAQLELMPR